VEDEDDALSDKQLALLNALRDAERTGLEVDLRALARLSGYNESSIRTYFTKRLEGVFVFREADGSWRVRGAIRSTEEEFGRRMSQKAGAANDALKSADSWRSVVRKLLYEGQRRHYELSREELDLVAELTPEEPRPRTDEIPIQPTLFRR
jgi:hypothetical protein